MKAYLIALFLALVIGLNRLPVSLAPTALTPFDPHLVQPCGPQGDVSG